MNFSDASALFGVMLVLALAPGVSVLAVSARAAAFGLEHGIATTLGIVAGDVIFIVIAAFGLSVLADTMGPLFVLIKYLGAAYLVALGILLWRSNPEAAAAKPESGASLAASFITGLLITLGDQKAILFYLGFFPAFVDLATLSHTDAALVILLATLAITLAKLGYALPAAKAGWFVNVGARRTLNRIIGSIITGVGIALIIRA